MNAETCFIFVNPQRLHLTVTPHGVSLTDARCNTRPISTVAGTSTPHLKRALLDLRASGQDYPATAAAMLEAIRRFCPGAWDYARHTRDALAQHTTPTPAR